MTHGQTPPSALIRGFHGLSLYVALFAFVFWLPAQFTDLIPLQVIQGATIVVGVVAVAQFLVAVFDRRLQDAVLRANLRITGGRLFTLKGPGLRDPDWGFSGRYTGPRWETWIRLALIAETLFAAFSAGRNSSLPPTALMAFAAFAILVLRYMHRLKSMLPSDRRPTPAD